MSDQRLASKVGQRLAALLDQRNRDLAQAQVELAQLELLAEEQAETITTLQDQLQSRNAWGDQHKENE